MTTIKIPKTMKTSRRAKNIVSQMNRYIMGSDKETKVKESTLIEHGLGFLVDDPLALKAIRKVVGRKRDMKPDVKKDTIKVTVKKIPKFNKQDVVTFIKEHYKNEATKQTYLNAYDNNKHRSTESNFPDFSANDLLNPEFLENLKDNKQLKLILSPLSIFLTEKKLTDYKVYEFLKTKIKNILTKISQAYLLKTVTKTGIEENLVTLIELKSVFEDSYDALFNLKELSYKINRKQLFNQALLSGFYTVNGFRDDICNGLLKKPETDSENKNYIQGNKYYLNDYKTFKSHGQLEFSLPEKLLKVIKESEIEFPRKYIIIMPTDVSQRGDKILTRTLSKPLGKDITINNIRRAWVSEVFSKSPEDSYELAKKMGHSFSEAMLVYRRLNKK
jgi:hypothetical protein